VIFSTFFDDAFNLPLMGANVFKNGLLSENEERLTFFRARPTLNTVQCRKSAR